MALFNTAILERPTKIDFSMFTTRRYNADIPLVSVTFTTCLLLKYIRKGAETTPIEIERDYKNNAYLKTETNKVEY